MIKTVFDYLVENKEWLFSGGGLAALSLLALIINRYVINPRTSNKTKPIATDPLLTKTPTDDGNDDGYSSHPTPKEIGDGIKSTPPFQQNDIEKNYLGIKVKWKLSLALVHPGNNSEVTLSCNYKGYFGFVHVNTRIEDYPEIKILKDGQKITVYGEIVGIEISKPVVTAHKLIFH